MKLLINKYGGDEVTNIINRDNINKININIKHDILIDVNNISYY